MNTLQHRQSLNYAGMSPNVVDTLIPRSLTQMAMLSGLTNAEEIIHEFARAVESEVLARLPVKYNG